MTRLNGVLCLCRLDEAKRRAKSREEALEQQLETQMARMEDLERMLAEQEQVRVVS